MTSAKPQPDEMDSPWKKILRQYLREALEFYFPDIAAIVDWTEPPVFLDKELVQIAPNAKVGKRHADQLVKLKHKKGKELVLLLHAEVQASPEAIFPERVYIYSFRIFDLFRIPVISIAILCDGDPKWRPNHYEYSLPQTKMRFEFGTAKLLDYKTQLAALEASTNPFAWVTLAHLKMQETKRDKPSRKVWKMRLVRRLYEAGYNEENVMNLFRFIDWVLKLPKALEAEFWQELQVYEESRKMPYITSVERIGYDRGQKEGRQEGRQEGKVLMLLGLLTRKFGSLTDSTIDRINHLSSPQIEALGDSIFDLVSIEDLTHWLATQPDDRE
jgi:hypothetical protein